MQISIIIVNYNVKAFLYQCLDSVQRASKELDTEIIVVDNASTDGSVEYLRPLFPKVQFIENKENIGFARANNRAIKQAKGKYILLLNPDTFIGENTLSDCWSFMEGHPEVGCTGARMLKSDGTFAFESRRGLPSPFTAFCKMSGLSSLLPYSRVFGKYYMRYLDEHQATPIDIVSGAFAFIRAKALDKAGLLDESFFMYGEDIDLSYRILKAGYQNYYLPTRIIHYKGESTSKNSYRYIHVFYQAMLIFFNKHYKHYHYLFSLPIKTAIYGKAILALIRQQKDRWQEWLQPTEPFKDRQFLMVGSIECFKQMEQALSQHLATVTYAGTTVPESLKGYDYLAFDAKQFSYKEILDTMERRHQKGLELATFFPETGQIITRNFVW